MERCHLDIGLKKDQGSTTQSLGVRRVKQTCIFTVRTLYGAAAESVAPFRSGS